MTNFPKDARVSEIAGQLCDLLDQQMNAITVRGSRDLTDVEGTGYEQRRTQISTLRSELKSLAYPN